MGQAGEAGARTIATAGALGRRNGNGGVLLVANLPDGPLVGGVEVGVDMILASELKSRHAMVLFNTARRPDPSRPLHRRLAYQTSRFTELVYEIVRTRPRVVHVKATIGVNYWQGIGYCAIGRALGRRVLLQLHGGDFDVWYRQHGRGARFAIGVALRMASELIVLSEYWRSFVAGLRPRRPIHVVPNGVRTEEALPRFSRTGEELRVVTLGALGERKGHFDILDAAAVLRDEPIRFLFAGADECGGEETALRRRAAALGVDGQVEWLGTVTAKAKWRLLAESDIFLLPSRAENMPNGVLEAMAAGMPVVCTRVGALADMLEEGALFVQPGAPGEIAAALRLLRQAPARRLQMGRSNRARAEGRFDFRLVARALDELYGEPGA